MERRRVSLCLALLLPLLISCLSARPAAAAAWEPMPLWGGEVLLAVRAGDPSTVYAATLAAGLYRSTDGGLTWHFVALGPNRSAIRSLWVDPHDEDRLFAVTGDGDASRSFRSEDGGRRWQRLLLRTGSAQGTANVFDLAFDPERPGVVYAASARGLFRSRDGGDSWARIAFEQASVGRVAVAPSNPDVVLVAVLQDDRRTIHRSTDGGQTFTEVFDHGSSGFVFDPVRPQRVYGFTISTLFVSEDLGATWISRPGPSVLLTLEVTSSGTLLAGGLGVRRSLDAGETWTPDLEQSALPADTVPSLAVLGDRVLAGGSRGVWRSETGGRGWRASSTGIRAHWVNALEVGGDGTLWTATWAGLFQRRGEEAAFRPVGGFGRGGFDLLAVHPRHSEVAYFLSGDLWKTEDRGETWRLLSYPGVRREPQVLEIDPLNPDFVYAGGYFEPHGRPCTAVRSTDGGETWSCMAGLAESDLSALAIDPHQPRHLIAASGGGLFESTDRGAAWTRIPGQVPGFRRLEMEPFRSRRLYAISEDSVLRSDDGGRTWQVKLTLQRAFLRDLLLDPERPGRLWVAAELPGKLADETTSRVFRSEDAGEHWVGVNRGLRPGTVIHDLAADPRSADVIYAGTAGRGLFRLVVEDGP